MDKSKFKDSIRLGLMPPQSGLVEMYGPEIVWAARIACDEINEQGGLLGMKLELIIEDDGSLPQSAVPAAQRLIDDHHCSAIIGNLLSNSRIAVADKVAQPQRIPYLNFSFYEGSIASRYFFHFAALPNQQIDKMIPYMADHYGHKMYFAGNNYEWPRGSIDAAKRALDRIQGEAVGEEYLPIGADDADIIDLLERVARSGADVFVPYFAGRDQITLLNHFAEMGLKSHMAVVMGHYDEVLASYLSPHVRQGFYSVNTYFMSADTAQNRHYLTRLRAQPDVTDIWPNGNGVLTNFGEGTYLCVKAFAYAVEMAGSTDSEALVDALEYVRISGPQGEVRMDPSTHHAHVNTFLARCEENGAFTIIEKFGANPPRIPERYSEQFKRQHIHEPPASPQSAARIASEMADSGTHFGKANRILSIADIAVLATNEQGLITEANQATAELFDYTIAEMIGMSVHMLLPPHFRQQHAVLMAQFVAGTEEMRRMGERGEVTGYRKDGTFIPLEASIAKFRNGGEWVLVVTMRDLTEIKRAEEALTHRATHDSLTGLPNRTLIRERLDMALQRTQRIGDSVGLLFIDIDGFKGINDTYGHGAGDCLLQEVAKRLLTQVRPGDTVSRLAGDEFLVLSESVKEPSSISSLATRITETIEEPFYYNGTPLFVSASIGITVGEGSTHSTDEMLRAADTAMYASKAMGGNTWQFFSEALQQEAERRLTISNGLRTAIENNELEVRFQPIVSAETGIISGAELLLRWFPQQGEISPADFIPVAEISGSIVAIGRWVFEQACLAERRWRELFGADAPYVTVNLSARQLSEAGLTEELAAILHRTEADASRIVLEVTETSLMADIASNRAVLEKLSALGMKTAVDDFGTGYSSLAQLLRLQMDTLKIDREFIDGMDSREESRVVVSAICRMAKSLKLKLVAEGVETTTQRDIVRSFGCDYIQGYYYYRPLEEQQFIEAVRNTLHTKPGAPDKLHYLIYLSRASDAVDTHQIEDILSRSRQFNISHAVTGHLLYLDGIFLQYLEGDRSRVQALFQNITDDPRHRDVTLLAEGELENRLFSDWEMGFNHLGKQRLGNNAADTGIDTFRWFSSNPAFCSSLFEAISQASN